MRLVPVVLLFFSCTCSAQLDFIIESANSVLNASLLTSPPSFLEEVQIRLGGSVVGQDGEFSTNNSADIFEEALTQMKAKTFHVQFAHPINKEFQFFLFADGIFMDGSTTIDSPSADVVGSELGSDFLHFGGGVSYVFPVSEEIAFVLSGGYSRLTGSVKQKVTDTSFTGSVSDDFDLEGPVGNSALLFEIKIQVQLEDLVVFTPYYIKRQSTSSVDQCVLFKRANIRINGSNDLGNFECKGQTTFGADENFVEFDTFPHAFGFEAHILPLYLAIGTQFEATKPTLMESASLSRFWVNVSVPTDWL